MPGLMSRSRTDSLRERLGNSGTSLRRIGLEWKQSVAGPADALADDLCGVCYYGDFSRGGSVLAAQTEWWRVRYRQ